MPELDTAAPAQPDTPITPSATEAAIASGDVASYREARHAERTGTPAPAPKLATPAPDAAASAPQSDERTVSKRQQQINDYERRIAEQNERIARLESGQRPAQTQPTAPRAEPPAEKFPKYAEYLQTHPDADLEDWIDARDTFRDSQRERATQSRVADEHTSRWHAERASNFGTQMDAARTADADFMTKLSPEVAQLEPAAIAIAAGRPISVDNAIAEEIIDSKVAPQLMLHLSLHPDALTDLRQAKSPRELARRIGALEREIDRAPGATASPAPKTVSSAPAPATTLGTRPTAPSDPERAAVNNGDVRAYRASRDAARRAQRA